MQTQIHNYYLSQIKKLLRASFVGWVQEKEDKYLKIVINKQSIPVPFDKGKIITEDSYKKFIKDIIENGHKTI